MFAGSRCFQLSTAATAGDGAACVECSHRQLCARFTDRLSGDNADRFTDVDETVVGQ